jgi:hypothetical protein
MAKCLAGAAAEQLQGRAAIKRLSQNLQWLMIRKDKKARFKTGLFGKLRVVLVGFMQTVAQ